ncbi:flavin-containing monooxygenase [Pseudomarimonas salicorniae]|uniref:NAD(P)/FAD-dependent oxidoreductase n=1 Tax=Pseudomarimonas salicorniae TaxID=2933270 RepID=A0ABT0GJM6_9GAMM|nr:NAD(P)/FAD-dependent oxidoreductase [Lysobacter sp. CAU 1642]MCK7594755.1 NAD(P)/FAD-dependent oxidoreductase [Lysobacter sp. CAU 1642]
MSASGDALDCLIVGAGFSGLAMARALQRQGGQRYLVLEKAELPGGTWRDNRYPGAACDVPSHLYSLSDAPNAHWTRLFPSQAEILGYLRELASPIEREGRLRYGERVKAAHWDAQEGLWQVRCASGAIFRSRDLVFGTGGLHHPAWPGLHGLDDFAGPLLHSARWDAGFNPAGKRIGVIGSGASAVQIIPELARDAAELHVAMRTPPWVLPRPDRRFPEWLQGRFAAWPWLRLAVRSSVFVLLEVLAHALIHPRTAFWARWLGNRLRRRQVADPALREALRPDYPVGCKRVLFSSDFYPALCAPNTTVHRGAIAAIDARGWRLADGQRVDLDAIVCATGFDPLRLREDIEITGRDGHCLSRDWADRPAAHLGIGVAGYPNLFFLLGPNTALGHNSVLFMIESQVRHIQALRALRAQRGAVAVEPKEEVQRAFLLGLDRRFSGTAWSAGCTSWYVDARGRNIALWVGPALAYRWRTRTPRPADYLFSDGPGESA